MTSSRAHDCGLLTFLNPMTSPRAHDCGLLTFLTLMTSSRVTDYGLLTFLNQDPDIQALQVQNKDGDWIDAAPPPGALIVNIGDMSHKMTSGIYKSTNHRVVHNGASDRISVPFFYECNFDAVVEPVGTAEQQRRGLESYGTDRTEACYGWHLVNKINSNFAY